jgi:hypothetical protein
MTAADAADSGPPDLVTDRRRDGVQRFHGTKPGATMASAGVFPTRITRFS